MIDPLEQRQLMAVTPVETYYQDLVSVDVVGRHLFYNNSAFDGNNAAVNASDDLAIATDKVALLPGGTASFANYTSYSRGINGVMVDIAGLPSNTLTADDFTFRTGNTNSPAGWTTPPTPSITVRLGAGEGGSARVELVWADGAIAGQWLEVTVKASPGTGLAAPDIFYFGNAIGDSGNSPADAIVDAVDVQGAVNNPRTAGNPAPVTFAWDYNRDKLVDATDQAIANNNQTNVNTALNLVAPPTVDTSPEYQRPPLSLYNWGDGGVNVQYAPILVTTNAGTVLAFSEARSTAQDSTGYGVILRRSTDSGVTFEPVQTLFAVTPNAGIRINGGAAVVDRSTGTIYYFYSRDVDTAWVMQSTDDGVTWTTPQDITTDVKVTAGNNPGPPGMYPDTPWKWLAFGPGHGIQIENGAHAGRMVIPVDHRETTDNSGPSWSHIIYSDDHGASWKLGGGLLKDAGGGTSPNDYSNENEVVELSGGVLYMNIRSVNDLVHLRGESFSSDGGITWSTMQLVPEQTTPSVQGSLVRLNDGVILFAAPANKINDTRHSFTIWASYDDAQTWTVKRTVFFGNAGYSDMTLIGPDTVLLAFNRGRFGGINSGSANDGFWYDDTALVRVNLRWLESDDPYQFTYYFNEGSPGDQLPNGGATIQDYGPWDQRLRGANVDPINLNDASYVAGRNGDSALRLTASSDEVVLSTSDIQAFQYDVNDSFTLELVMQTADTDGVIIGTRPGIKGYVFQIVGGKLQLSITDLTNTATITSTANVNDGAWHHVAAVRDATTKTLSLFIDGVAAATPVADTTSVPRNNVEPRDPMVLGSYNSGAGSSQLEFTVDTLRITSAALTAGQFLPDNLVATPPLPDTTFPANAPTSIPGLQLWLPAYDPTRYFDDVGLYAQVLPLDPFQGMGARSVLDASTNRFRTQSTNQYRYITYGEEDPVGPYWNYKVDSINTLGTQLRVQQSNGGYAKNFDFVQNTGVFTLSTFVKVSAETGSWMTIFSNNLGTAALPGFTLLRQQSGRLFMGVTQGQNNFSRFAELSPVDGVVPLGEWMHVAVVGSGPGNPVKFYITPAGSNQVVEYTSSSTLIGADGSYPTDFTHDLLIGGGAGVSPWQGGMVNQAIYNTALSKAQIQQLFDFGTGQTAPDFPWQNPNNPLDVDGNGLIQNVDLLQVINRLIALGITDLAPPSEGSTPPPYIDTTGNNHLEPLDALRIVNYLIANPPGSSSAQATALATSQATDAANQAIFATVAATPAAAAAESTPAAESASFVFALPSSMAANTPPRAGAADLTVTSNPIAEAPAPATAAVVNVSASYVSAKRRVADDEEAPLAADLALDALRRDDFELDCDLLAD